MMGVILFDNGTAKFLESLISSYLLPECTYSVEGDELVFRPVINDEFEKEFYGVDSDDFTLLFLC
jgi:hypothetical protein